MNFTNKLFRKSTLENLALLEKMYKRLQEVYPE